MARSRVKKNSILNYIAVALITILGIVLSVCSFNVPFTSFTYNGFANSIPLGLDLAGGISVVYDCSLSNDSNTQSLDTAIDGTLARLRMVIQTEYPEATVERQGSSKIRIEVPTLTDSNEIFDLIGEPTPLYMTLDQNASAEARIVGSDIKNVQAGVQQDANGEYVYGVSLQFTEEGAKKFSVLTKDAAEGNQVIYIYLGEIDDSADMQLTCEEQITGDSTFISGSFETLEDAENYALQIMSGTFSVNLNNPQINVISATLGGEALNLAIIGGVIGLVVALILLWCRYGDFSFLSAFSLIIFAILMLFFLQAIPFVQLTLTGIAGIVLSFAVTIGGTIFIFEKIREEYRTGKKIPLSVKSGFKKALWPILDSHIVMAIVAIFLWIFGTSSIQGFAIPFLIGIVLSLFVNLVVLRFFVKWYLPFNSVKAKKLHLPKQVRVFKENDEAVVGGQANE